MPDRETIAAYNARAQDYAARFDREDPGPALVDFLARLTPPAHILDLGCGPGGSAAHMAAAGHTLDLLDASHAMVARAHDRGLPARQGDFTDLAGPYDAIWANFSLLHMPRSDLPGYLPQLGRALSPGGLLHLGLKAGSGEARDRLGRYYTYWQPAEIAALLTSAGFHPEPPREGTGQGLAGDTERFFVLLATRAGD